MERSDECYAVFCTVRSGRSINTFDRLITLKNNRQSPETWGSSVASREKSGPFLWGLSLSECLRSYSSKIAFSVLKYLIELSKFHCCAWIRKYLKTLFNRLKRLPFSLRTILIQSLFSFTEESSSTVEHPIYPSKYGTFIYNFSFFSINNLIIQAILDNFVSRKIVFVSMNYRLGPLGKYLVGHPSLSLPPLIPPSPSHWRRGCIDRSKDGNALNPRGETEIGRSRGSGEELQCPCVVEVEERGREGQCPSGTSNH